MMTATRREFLKQSAAVTLLSGLGGVGFANEPKKLSFLRRLKHPVAIAMWDFSWLLRTHPGGGFENWDRALDDLAERGYNAVRIDAFPHLVAVAERPDGPKKFHYGGPAAGRHMLWGNDLPVDVDPRAALVEFLPKCRQRGTHPHFKRLWADVAWHKRLTQRIRSAGQVLENHNIP